MVATGSCAAPEHHIKQKELFYGYQGSNTDLNVKEFIHKKGCLMQNLPSDFPYLISLIHSSLECNQIFTVISQLPINILDFRGNAE